MFWFPTLVGVLVLTRVGLEARYGKRSSKTDLDLWIDEQQVKLYSGFLIPIYIIDNGTVVPTIIDPNLEKQLPVFPPQINCVNFTWKAGPRKNYTYYFTNLQSFNINILNHPSVSISEKGMIPRKPSTFSIFLPCSGNNSGIAHFSIGFMIETKFKNFSSRPIRGMPLKLNLRKECTEIRLVTGPDSECSKKCMNEGWCDENKLCKCPHGYMGRYCEKALCYPDCENNGTCTAPGVCSCPPGFHGSHCEGGMCSRKCENGGKCIQKDTCKCTSGFFGLHCEFSKCMVPCLNDGHCIGENECRCKKNFRGKHCQIEIENQRPCKPRCHNGVCKNNRCKCDPGWTGRKCRQNISHKKFSDPFLE